MWSFWNKVGFFLILQKRHPTLDIPFWAAAYLAISLLLVILLSRKMYSWEVRVVYGRLFDKLKETIAEMDKLKQGE